MVKITTHTIVKNEENWVGYAIKSVLPFALEMLVADDNSSDNTAEIIKSIKDPKIKFSKENLKSAAEHTALRNKMLAETKTDWFLILDGDEVWNFNTFQRLLVFLESLDKSVYGVVVPFRNCVGDVWHYLPEETGGYQLLERVGNITIRAYRKIPGFKWVGDYPLEAYVDDIGIPTNSQPDRLRFFDGFYWHLTHLPRSSFGGKVKGWRKTKIEKGIRVVDKKELPEVFDEKALQKRSVFFETAATLATPFKIIKRVL